MTVCSKTVKYAALPGLSPALLLRLEGALNKKAGCAPPVPKATKKPDNIGPGPSQLLDIQAALNKQALVETSEIANTISIPTDKAITENPSGFTPQNVLPQRK